MDWIHYEENDVPANVIESVDSAVLAALPPEMEVLDIIPHGASLWTRTAEIKTKQADGSKLSFFLKALKGDNGKTNSRGEFASMTALHAANPELTPQPIAVGTYDSDPSIHFFLCEFVDMTNDLPDLHNFPEALAKLHRNGVSPTGQYGFGVPTCMGNGRPFYTKWTESWEEFFVNFFLDVVEYEQEVQGPDEEMAALTKQIVEKVIPRLCRPLETGGRSIKPLLIHGDLWDGNASVVVRTGQPVIYDAAAMYAHNELEFMTFVMPRHKMNWPYIKEYTKFFPPSEPVEDFEDRLTLYGSRFQMICSCVYPGDLRFRNYAKIDMKKLIDKYPNGYDDFKDKAM